MTMTFCCQKIVVAFFVLSSFSQAVMANDGVSSTRRKGPAIMHEIYDSTLGVTFINELSDRNTPHPATYGLCRDARSKGGEFKANASTIKQILGPNLKKIVVLRVTSFETMDLFSLAQQAISGALQKSPKTISRYEPWANAVTPDFVGRLEYDDGKTGQLEMTYGYICFEDHSGTHWWARVATPDDLNLDSVSGILEFKSGRGYSIVQPDGHHIWLKVSEQKLLVAQLESMTNKQVIAHGELRKIPMNVVTSIPAGESYLEYGFTLSKLSSQ